MVSRDLQDKNGRSSLLYGLWKSLNLEKSIWPTKFAFASIIFCRVTLFPGSQIYLYSLSVSKVNEKKKKKEATNIYNTIPHHYQHTHTQTPICTSFCRVTKITSYLISSIPLLNQHVNLFSRLLIWLNRWKLEKKLWFMCMCWQGQGSYHQPWRKLMSQYVVALHNLQDPITSHHSCKSG